MSLQPPSWQNPKPGEWHDALWHQYMNCIDSLRTQNSESTAAGGTSSFESHPSWEAFEGNVAILHSMTEGYGLFDDDYTKNIPDGDFDKTSSLKVFSQLTALLKRKNIWQEGRTYLGRI